MALVSIEGYFLRVNESLCEMLGYSEDEMLQSRFQDITFQEDLETDLAYVADVLNGKRKNYAMEKRYIKKDGSLQWILLSVSLVFRTDGSPKYFIAQIQDIQKEKEKKELEAKLLEKEERINLAVHAAKIGIWDWHLPSNALHWDDSMYEIYELPAHIFDGLFDIWQQSILPEDHPAIMTQLNDVIRNGHVFDAEFRIRTAAGRLKFLKTKAKLIRDETGSPVRMMGANWDITEVKEKEAQLVEARERAHEASAVKSQFLANMSHEIRTPLNGIIGMTDVLLTESFPPHQFEALETIKSCCRGLMDIVNDVLDLSKIESGFMTLKPHVFDLHECLRSVTDLHQLQAKAKSLKLTLENENSSLQINADEGKVRQVLNNLLSNALKFTKEGGISIAVEHKADSSPAEILITVTDSGIGIEPDNLESIFTPFQQVDNSKTREVGGTGLGLTICRKVAQMMGGTLTVDSVPHVGSSFTFHFHADIVAHATKPQNSDQAGRDQTAPSNNLRILVVEDNLINQKVIERMLAKLGYRCTMANDGLAAIQMAKKSQYDIIFMDIHLPKLNGIEATEQIRTQTANKDSVFVAITADIFGENREICHQVGMKYFLAKPIQIENLKVTIDQIKNDLQAA
jgi:PAS domain S-box-containing protein